MGLNRRQRHGEKKPSILMGAMNLQLWDHTSILEDWGFWSNFVGISQEGNLLMSPVKNHSSIRQETLYMQTSR